MSAAFAYTSAPKDSTEVSLLRGACQHTCKVFNMFVKPNILNIVDVEQRVKQSKVAEDIEAAMLEGKFLPKGLNMDNEHVSARGCGFTSEEEDFFCRFRNEWPLLALLGVSRNMIGKLATVVLINL